MEECMTVLDAEFIKGESRLRSLRANLSIDSWSKALIRVRAD